MELFSTNFLSALVAIIIIDPSSGRQCDCECARRARLPSQLAQACTILWGTVGAIVVRSAMTLIVVWLLKIPGLLAHRWHTLLVWIAYK